MEFDAPGMLAPAELPAALISASDAAGRALLVAGGQPGAVVLLLNITARGISILALALFLVAVA